MWLRGSGTETPVTCFCEVGELCILSTDVEVVVLVFGLKINGKSFHLANWKNLGATTHTYQHQDKDVAFVSSATACQVSIMIGPTSCYLHKIVRLWNSLSSPDLSLSSSSIRHHFCDPYVTHFVLNNFLYLCYDCPIASFITWPLTALLGWFITL